MPIETKLVRDEVVRLMEADDEKVDMYIADEKDFPVLLNMKLREECEEAISNPCLEEFADVVEVIYAMAKLQGFDMHQIETARHLKVIEKGSFEKRQVVTFRK